MNLVSLNFVGIMELTLVIGAITSSSLTNTRKNASDNHQAKQKYSCFIELAMQLLPDLKMSIWVQ